MTFIINRAAILVLLLAPGLRAAEDLKIIDHPGGGQIVYGALPGAGSFRDAMATMLRNVHGHFGDRPRIGKFFQARGSDSLATFFSLSAKKQGGAPISGLVIVSLPKGGAATAAVLYDEAGRFSRTGPDMMRVLNQAWQSAAQPAAAGTARAEPPRDVRLTSATAGDRSASIGLPPGWQLTGVSGGQLTAEGPQGEMVFLGLLYQGIQNPGARQDPRFFGAKPLVCAYGKDLFQSYVSIANQVRGHQGKPAASFRLLSSRNLPGSGNERLVAEVHYEADLHDGKGQRKGTMRIGEIHVQGLPTWAMTLSGSNAPVPVADAQAPTIMAVVHSYRQDAAVIGQETKVAIDKIHAVGRAAAIRAEAQSASNDARNKAFHAHMDDLDRSSKSFQNYQLDRSQLQDNDRNERGTVSAGAADALVKANPDRFQIVQRQDYLKGVDY